MPTTEIAGFPLSAGADIDDPNGEAVARIEEWSASIVQQQGHQESWYGVTVEKADDLVAVITWDNIEAHIATLRRPDYKVITDRISSIFAGAGYMYHIDFEPYEGMKIAMAAPVTEIATFYFDDEPPEGYLERFREFSTAAGKEQGARPSASAVGVTHEEVEYEDGKGNAVVFIAGWESVDAHMAFRNSATFKDYMPQLKDEADKVFVHHVSFRKV